MMSVAQEQMAGSDNTSTLSFDIGMQWGIKKHQILYSRDQNHGVRVFIQQTLDHQSGLQHRYDGP